MAPHTSSGIRSTVVTTDYSDWATNCPEYKVTAVEVRPTLVEGGVGSAVDLGLEELEESGHMDVVETLARMANQTDPPRCRCNRP